MVVSIMKITRRNLLRVTLFLLSPLIVLSFVLITVFAIAFVSGEVQHYQIRSEVFEYVDQHKESIELNNPEYPQYFEYTNWGYIDSGIIYGYFYSPHDEYESHNRPYRNGYLRYGTPYSGADWCYFEEICDDWYYYEEHYG